MEITVLMLAISTSYHVNGHSHTAYNYDRGGLGTNSDWQARLDNSLTINKVSYPGTHDTMADDNDGQAVDCQAETLTRQLEAGIRALDIRCRAINGIFAIHHAAFYLSVNFGDVLNECKNFLRSHPNEFILMRVKQEYSSVSNTDFENIFKTYYDSSSYSSYMYQTSSNSIPTVGDVRGKIVILQNFGASRWYGPSYTVDNIIQDDYSLANQLDLYSKWEAIKANLDAANSNYNSLPSNRFYINFLSGSGHGGAYPWWVASGHSDPRTNAPRLTTGRTLGLFGGNHWRDFPRQLCITWPWPISATDCTIFYEGTNTLTYDHIWEAGLKYVGIVYIDYPGQGLIDRIINLNPFDNLAYLPYSRSNLRWKSRNGYKCVDLWQGGGDILIPATCSRTNDQRWGFATIDSGNKIYQIKSHVNNECVDLWRGGGNILTTAPCRNTNDQKWKIQEIGSGMYTIKLASDNTCVDLWASGNRLKTEGCRATNDQRWYFTDFYSSAATKGVNEDHEYDQDKQDKHNIPWNDNFTVLITIGGYLIYVILPILLIINIFCVGYYCVTKGKEKSRKYDAYSVVSMQSNDTLDEY